MSTITKDLGVVTAYGYYKAGGGTMTEAEFTQFMVDFGTASKTAVDAAEAALKSERAAKQSEEAATRKASEAGESASTASTKAGEAARRASDADTAKNDAVAAKNAAETAQGKAEDAQEAAERVAESIPSDYSQLSEDVSELKSGFSDLKEDLQDLPNVVETDETDSDLDIADPDGNVLVRFANGQIETKEFNSADIQKTEPTDADGAFDLADSEGYVLVRLKDGHIQTKGFNSEYVPSACEYLFADDGSILLSYGYNDTHDAVVSMDEGRANGLFDFKALMLKPKGKLLAECGSSDFSTVWLTGTDMHSPFEFLAVNDPDGYYADSTDPSYTGGNHTADINGVTVQTAKSDGVRYFADGKPVTSGHGVFTKFEMRWANEVQAYNCVKADGTGRTSLTEHHDMIFDGVKFDEEITLIPDEDINMYLWHGLQAVGWNGVYDRVYFLDATNRQIFTPTDSNIKSGNAITSGVVQYGDAHAMRMDIDTTEDLGKRPNYNGTEGAFMSSSIHKGYFRIFYGSPVLMAKDSVWYLHGSFRFYPV
jgi:hypothetical protein